MNKHVIDIADCTPDDVLLRNDTMADLYIQIRKSQQNRSWEGPIGILKSPGVGLRHLFERLFKKRISVDAIKVGGILLKAEGCNDLDCQDMWTAVNLLYELYECPVPRFNERTSPTEHRYVFFYDTEHWVDFFPQMHAIWSEDDRVVVFYGWGHVQSFYKWAVSFHPDLARKISSCGDKIVVVVPSIRPMTKNLLLSLERERDRLWKYLISSKKR